VAPEYLLNNFMYFIFFLAITLFILLYIQNLKKEIRNRDLILIEKEKSLFEFKNQLTNKEIQLNQSVEKANDFADKLYLSYSQLTDLDSLLREINASIDLKGILKILANYVKEKYKIPHYVLYTFDSNASELVFYDSNFPDELSDISKNEISSRKIPLNTATTTKYAHAYAWKRKRSFFIADLTKYKTSGVELANQNSVNLKSLLIVPLFLRQKFIGTLDLLDYSGNLHLSEQELNQIKIIGDYIAGSIETGFLMDELQSKNLRIVEEKNLMELNREKLESLNRLMRSLNSFNKIDDIVSEVLHYLKTYHRVELAFLLLVDDKHNCLRPLLTTKEIFNKGLLVNNFFKNFKVDLSFKSGSLFRTYTKKKPLYLRKAVKWTNISNYDQKIVEAFKLDSIAQIPLVVKNKCIGIICLTRLTSEMDWSKNEFIEICSFSEQVAGAIHNAYLMRDLELEREKSMKMLRNILPDELAAELMETGEVLPMEYESATILFTDFKNLRPLPNCYHPKI
jgi:transcriptional regulator with GAF, ATPase, and Fis domain